MSEILIWIVILLFIVFILHKILKKCKYSSSVRRSGYDELLSDSRWKQKREKILERDKHCCQWCHSRYNLQVHHKAYHKFPNGQKVDPWDYPDRLLKPYVMNVIRNGIRSIRYIHFTGSVESIICKKIWNNGGKELYL